MTGVDSCLRAGSQWRRQNRRIFSTAMYLHWGWGLGYDLLLEPAVHCLIPLVGL